MTKQIFGEDSYIECDWYTVVYVHSYSEYEEKFRPEHTCYCGEPCVQMARVGFHTDTSEKTAGPWPSCLSQNVKAHRCGEHRFEEPDD